MTSPNVSTTQAGMTRAAGKFGEKAGEFTTAQSNVSALVAELKQTWHGKASQTFQAAMVQWDEAFGRIITELRQLESDMTDTGHVYSKGEDEALDTVSALPSVEGLNGI